MPTEVTFSPRRNIAPRWRMKYINASIISRSAKSRIVGRASMTVTLMFRALTIDAYSSPMTPAPTMMRSRGSVEPFSSWSESMIRSPSRGTVACCAGRVPQAIRIFSAEIRVAPSEDATSRVCGSRKRAAPWRLAMRFRPSWARTTSISLAMTFCTRKARSGTVISLRTE